MSGRHRESDRDMLTESVDLTAERSGGVYLVSLYDPHVWMLRKRAHTRTHIHRSGYHHSSVISVSRLRFLIVDMAAISWIWKKQKRARSLKSYAPSKV